MTLQYQMDSLEGLDEATAKLYIQRDGKYFLDVTGHEQTVDRDSIPRSRLNQEIEKRKASEAALKEVADKLIEDVPEGQTLDCAGPSARRQNRMASGCLQDGLL